MSNEKIEYLNLELLHPFENNPFQSVDEKEYDELRDSIQELIDEGTDLHETLANVEREIDIERKK